MLQHTVFRNQETNSILAKQVVNNPPSPAPVTYELIIPTSTTVAVTNILLSFLNMLLNMNNYLVWPCCQGGGNNLS